MSIQCHDFIFVLAPESGLTSNQLWLWKKEHRWLLVMSLFNLFVFLIFSYGSLGNKTRAKLKFGNDEIYYGGFRNYYFTPNPTDYSELLSSEEFESDFIEKSMENDFKIFFESDFPEGHDFNDLIRFNDATAKKFLLDQSIEAEHFNFTDDYESPEPKPNQVFIRRQVDGWENSGEGSNTFRNTESFYPKTENTHDYGQYFKENFPFNPRNSSSVERFESNHQVEPPQFYQNNNPLFRKIQEQNRNLAQIVSPSEEKLNLERTDEKFKRKKNQKKNPCKMYLQFLKYAFKELDKNPEYNDELDEEDNDWEADGSRQVFSTQLLGPTLYIDNSGRVFQVNSQGNSIQSVDRYFPTLRDSEKNFIGQNLMTTSPPSDHKTETAPVPPIYNSFILTYDRSPELINKNTESSVSDENTHSPTVSTEMNKETAVTEWPVFLTTIPSLPPPSQQPAREETHRKSGLPWEHFSNNMESNTNYSSVGPAVYVQRPENSTTSTPHDENFIRANTKVSFESKLKNDNKEPDCNDKMLPCPDTFNITYPLNGYCNRYVSCESGVAIRRTCANGFHFNVITKSCDLPHNSICSYFCPEPNGRYGIPGDCTGYFICENSIAEYRMCPPRMHWDVRTHSCTFAALSSCPMKCSNLNEIKPYKGDCRAYIICHNGIPFYHKCPSKFIFNRESHTCVPENLYSCKDDPRLMTKTLNPSHLCKNVDEKLGESSWCKYYNSTENARAEEKFIEV